MAVALITGTSTGIGHATALALARGGYTVYATMRTPERTPDLLEIAAAEGLKLFTLPLDVTSDESVKACFDRVYAEAGAIDVLVNNAGVGALGPVEEQPVEAFIETMDINFFGVVRCVKAVLPRMREQRSGCIINISSVAGRIVIAPEAPYTASKFAVEGFSEGLAQEVKGFNIRVALVEPGIVRTPILIKEYEALVTSMYPHTLRMRATFLAAMENPVYPETVAEQVLSIANSDSWTLRYPVGPDVRPLLTLRRRTTDEEWVERYGEADDEEWCRKMDDVFFGVVDFRRYLAEAKALSSPKTED